jgi:citrate lyase subunit beta/citryl-CoA lyase
LNSEADAIIIDLEDSIALTEKRAARENVADVLVQMVKHKKPIYIRVNDLNSDFWVDDVEMVSKFPGLGIMLPKAESKKDIERLNARLTSEQFIIPLVETAKGVMDAYEISRAGINVKRLAFGAVDYCLDMGVSISTTGEELHYARSLLAIASKAAEIESPIDTVFVDINNDEGLMKETERAKQLGFLAKLCIHPRQLKIVNGLFTPSDEEIVWAEEVRMAFEKAESKGLAAINLHGKMIDYPVYKQAIQILKRFGKG